jgi:hypothetical protein
VLVVAAVTPLPARDGADMDNHTRTDAAARTPSNLDPNRDLATRMRILDARHSDIEGIPMLVVLVDRIPTLDELTFRAIDLEPDPLPQGDAATLYVGVHPDGYVTHLIDQGDGPGGNGEIVRLRMDDGTVRDVTGPYHGDDALIAWYAPELNVRADFGLIANRATYVRHQDGRGAIPAALMPDAADMALRLADSHTRHAKATPVLPPDDSDPSAAAADESGSHLRRSTTHRMQR